MKQVQIKLVSRLNFLQDFVRFVNNKNERNLDPRPPFSEKQVFLFEYVENIYRVIQPLEKQFKAYSGPNYRRHPVHTQCRMQLDF